MQINQKPLDFQAKDGIMEVYIVQRHVINEGNHVLAVFDNENDAEEHAAAARVKRDDSIHADDIHIDILMWTVNGESFLE